MEKRTVAMCDVAFLLRLANLMLKNGKLCIYIASYYFTNLIFFNRLLFEYIYFVH